MAAAGRNIAASAAAEDIAGAFLVCYKDLKPVLDDPNSSVEVKARIQEIFKENRPKGFGQSWRNSAYAWYYLSNPAAPKKQ